MCHFGTFGESFQNHHFLAGTRVTVKFALQAGPLGQLFELAIRPPKAIRQNSFAYSNGYRVVNEWNLLPSEIDLSKNVNEFKSKLDKHWQWKRFKFNNIY
jgi:hypothetical protein